MQTAVYNTERVMARIQELAGISETAGSITRTYGSRAWREAALTIQGWMQAAGLHVHIDNIGNVRGRLSCNKPGAKIWVIASHMDTVVNAGPYDGPLGIIMGLELLTEIIQQHTPLPFDIELVAFADEEGCRFHTTYLGSKVLAGAFEPALLEQQDAAGIPLRQVIHDNGSQPAQLPADAIPAESWMGYFEMHIEQGPVLYEKKIPVAFVQSIAGQRRVAVAFKGMAGHAGTVPMEMRQDALCCAAEFILAVEKTMQQHSGELLATVGKLEVENAASNVIPGLVACTLDLRSSDAFLLAAACNNIQSAGDAISRRRNVIFDWRQVQATEPVACDAALNSLLEQAINDAGYTPLPLVSGAGHDAVAIAPVAPVCMLFVRCYKGISHHPEENAAPEDVAAALQVAGNFMQRVIHQYNQL